MKTFMIGGAAAVAMTAFFVSLAMDSETPEYIAPLPTGEYEIGKVYSFDRPNAIDLETDRYNDSVKLFFDLPPGFVGNRPA
ncbi:hypothetical protein ACFSC1_04410 [Paracoccus aurantiacus]|uniref:hypothetical protein n=1 Tax=Paracoccus aurantiacus TaxID=2599412 RepID=UPI003634FF92